jgi:hypothetical protein
MDGDIFHGHFSRNQLWESYPVVKRIGFLCEDLDFTLRICLPDPDRCPCTRNTIPHNKITPHPKALLCLESNFPTFFNPNALNEAANNQ